MRSTTMMPREKKSNRKKCMHTQRQRERLSLCKERESPCSPKVRKKWTHSMHAFRTYWWNSDIEIFLKKGFDFWIYCTRLLVHSTTILRLEWIFFLSTVSCATFALLIFYTLVGEFLWKNRMDDDIITPTVLLKWEMRRWFLDELERCWFFNGI